MEFFYDSNRDGAWDSGRSDAVRVIRENFVPVILDSYLPGTPAEHAFVERLGRGVSNCLIAAAASGKSIGYAENSAGLMKLVEQYRAMPASERKPALEETTGGGDANHMPPTLPAGGWSLIVYQVPLVRGPGGELVRAPDLIAPGPTWNLKVPITMNDLVWATAEERKSLLPESPQKGQKLIVAPSLFRRLCITQAYDWSVAYQNNTLPFRGGELIATVEEVSAKEVRLRLEGFSKVGGAEENLRSCSCDSANKCPHWGCDLKYYGVARIDRAKGALSEFRVVALGETHTKYNRVPAKFGSEPLRYATALLIELPTDCAANRGGWPPLAPQRMREWFDYWKGGDTPK